MSFLVSSDYFCFKVCFSDIKISTSASFLVVFSWNWYLFLFLLTWNTMRYVSRSHWSPFKDQSCLLTQSISLCPYIRELNHEYSVIVEICVLVPVILLIFVIFSQISFDYLSYHFLLTMIFSWLCLSFSAEWLFLLGSSVELTL